MTAPVPDPPRHPSIGDLLADSPALERALGELERAAESEAPVLLLGEPGSGRTTVARAVHVSSPRAEGPLIEVDSGSIPVSLFESELFGHRRGAFTGAESSQTGRVERADGGSLLLDPVEEIPAESQAKLLRLLSERQYQPLGGTEQRADVRFLATGRADLRERVRRGHFRPDLFYRLEVLAFRLPPLRDRVDDLPRIAEHMIQEIARRLGTHPVGVAPESFVWMREHTWPGNLRELRNLLERSLVLPHGDELVLEPPPGRPGERPRPLREVEEEAIRRALAYTRGHQTRAAELLGISRKALWEKRKRYGIP